MMNKALQLMGLAMRAGKVTSGEEQVLKAIRSQTACVVFLANDASSATTKMFFDKCKSYQIPIEVCFSREELGQAIGKQDRVSIAVLEKGLAQKIREYC